VVEVKNDPESYNSFTERKLLLIVNSLLRYGEMREPKIVLPSFELLIFVDCTGFSTFISSVSMSSLWLSIRREAERKKICVGPKKLHNN
jgi:hypothetical protein